MNISLNDQYNSDQKGDFLIRMISGETSYIDDSDKEIHININKSEINSFCRFTKNTNSDGTLLINPVDYNN
jgi:hypothetical protein